MRKGCFLKKCKQTRPPSPLSLFHFYLRVSPFCTVLQYVRIKKGSPNCKACRCCPFSAKWQPVPIVWLLSHCCCCYPVVVVVVVVALMRPVYLAAHCECTGWFYPLALFSCCFRNNMCVSVCVCVCISLCLSSSPIGLSICIYVFFLRNCTSRVVAIS